MQYIIWIFLSLLLYVVCYLAILNLVDDFTKNRFFKIPVLAAASFPAAFLMAVLEYKPIFLIAFTLVANHYRIQQILSPENPSEKFKELSLNPMLFYTASYIYLILLCGLAYYFQIPVESGSGTLPLWQTWIPEQQN